ncbi:NAD(P)/FAD-dependent oxidoreductase [Aquimarina sp. MMG016]|uniref:NAD(P)/FAD-dependent oxidoreductase n=1 Tax=Aquimarina sp. MMG016 TaxID=2822690 RepID=UPI001B3A28FC|nr:NAD(P)/FAD-dependent oxidoreductase [Aquimarina sp. MMG016]MBQ4820765.1 FAD-dependent oxidoreductase [Aquimarina sp. MMG016]
MKKEAYKIHIVGAGISGLIAAQILENHGYSPVIIEATDRAGGRVKTDIIDGYQLDHGFQVLLTAYPAAQKYLDFDKLSLQKFLSGASIFTKGKLKTVGDPLRNPSLLIPTLFSNIGNFSDKVRVLRLNTMLKKKSIADIFNKNETTTLKYLQNYSFSEEMIHDFFRPFFSGIFLEPNLETSSRMFQFVYKMFGEGYAALPKDGIEKIVHQLVSKLGKTKFLFNSPVKQVIDGSVFLDNGEELKSDFTIVTSQAHQLIANLNNQEMEWKSCDTLYFEVDHRVIDKPLIGLIANEEALINNIFYHTSLTTSSTPKKELLSVTVVKDHQFSEKELIEKVVEELGKYCGINGCRFIKHYYIKQALPKLQNLQYELSETETKLTSRIFLAGDQLLNGSLNAAMISGERAALGIIKTLEDGLIVEEFTSEFN